MAQGMKTQSWTICPPEQMLTLQKGKFLIRFQTA